MILIEIIYAGPAVTCKYTEWSPSCEPFCELDGSTKEGAPEKRTKKLIQIPGAPQEHCDKEPEEMCKPCQSKFHLFNVGVFLKQVVGMWF